MFVSRKRKAKKSRETRKKTQPVPSDLFEKLSQLDSSVEKAEERGGEGEKVKEEVEKERKEFVEQLKSRDTNVCCLVCVRYGMMIMLSVQPSSQTKQSAFRPSARPAPRLRPPEVTPPQMAPEIQQTLVDK